MNNNITKEGEKKSISAKIAMLSLFYRQMLNVDVNNTIFLIVWDRNLIISEDEVVWEFTPADIIYK